MLTFSWFGKRKDGVDVIMKAYKTTRINYKWDRINREWMEDTKIVEFNEEMEPEMVWQQDNDKKSYWDWAEILKSGKEK